ncbi:MAG TPA: AI-2E family transporter [Candidatus Paceibacterota bacterium]
MQTTKRIQTTFFFVVILGVFFLAFFIFKPYLTPLFLAFVFYIVFKPAYRVIDRACRGRAWLSSSLTIVLIVLVVLVPFIIFGSLLFDDVRDLYLKLSEGKFDVGSFHALEESFKDYISVFAPGFTVDVEGYLSQLTGWMVDNVGSFFSGFMRFVVGLAIMLLALFAFFKDGEMFKKKMLLYSPLDDTDDRDIFDAIERSINSVVRGSLLVALVQGFLIMIGFAFTGIPNPVTWGSLGIVAALIPSFGTSLVLLPGILYLFFSGNVIGACILFVWGALVVGLIDNLLRPFLISRSVPIHPLLVLLSVIGGIGFFGLVGFVAGPITLSLLYVLGGLYPRVIGADSRPQ